MLPKKSLKLNCKISGDDPSLIFPVNILKDETVGDLEKKKSGMTLQILSLRLMPTNSV